MSIWKITPEFGIHHKAHWIEIIIKPLYSQNLNFLWVKIEFDHVQMIANLYNQTWKLLSLQYLSIAIIMNWVHTHNQKVLYIFP